METGTRLQQAVVKLWYWVSGLMSPVQAQSRCSAVGQVLSRRWLSFLPPESAHVGSPTQQGPAASGHRAGSLWAKTVMELCTQYPAGSFRSLYLSRFPPQGTAFLSSFLGMLQRWDCGSRAKWQVHLRNSACLHYWAREGRDGYEAAHTGRERIGPALSEPLC